MRDGCTVWDRPPRVASAAATADTSGCSAHTPASLVQVQTPAARELCAGPGAPPPGRRLSALLSSDVEATDPGLWPRRVRLEPGRANPRKAMLSLRSVACTAEARKPRVVPSRTRSVCSRTYFCDSLPGGFSSSSRGVYILLSSYPSVSFWGARASGNVLSGFASTCSSLVWRKATDLGGLALHPVTLLSQPSDLGTSWSLLRWNLKCELERVVVCCLVTCYPSQPKRGVTR